MEGTQQAQNISNQEEQKVSDQLSQLNLEDKKPQAREPYKFRHATKSWKSIVEELTPITEGKSSLEDTLYALDDFRKQYEPNKETNIDLLKELLLKNSSKKEQEEWEKELFPFIAQLIIKTPEVFTKENQVFLLSQNENEKQILTKEQCACLLANMFMCTVLDQNNKKLPKTFNFSEMFTAEKSRQKVKLEKIKCMGQYFRQIKKELPSRSVEFERIVYKTGVHGNSSLEAWKQCQVPLGKIEVKPSGKIEDAIGSIEVDFANKFLGGGVLRTGAAQEEIQFITSPEHLVGLLFCEVSEDHEAVKIRGCQIYSDSKGYLDHFAFNGGFQDRRPVAKDGILDREVLALDALNFRLAKTIPQWSEEAVLRELNKAYIGFYGSVTAESRDENKIIATGKWGCGAFQGDTQLKFILQWLASSRAGREMEFYSFGDIKNLKQADKVIGYYKGKTVGELVNDVFKNCEKMKDSDKKNPKELFNFLGTAAVGGESGSN